MTAITNGLALFFLVCLLVGFIIILLNIFSKSYQPKKSVGVISFLLALFIFGCFMFLLNLNQFTQELDRNNLTTNSSSQIVF